MDTRETVVGEDVTNEKASARTSYGVSLLAWNLMNGELQYKRSVSKPALFSHQEQLAITTGGYGSIIKVWRLPTLTEVKTLPHSEEEPSTYVYNMKLNQSGTILGAGVGQHGYGVDYVKERELNNFPICQAPRDFKSFQNF